MSKLTFKLAWRDLRAHRGLFALALLMFALPLFIVMGSSTMAVNSNDAYLWPFGVSDPVKDERIQLARADAVVNGPDGAIAFDLSAVQPTAEHPVTPFETQEVAPALLSGSSTLSPGGIIMSHHLADAAGLSLGAPVQISTLNGKPASVTLTLTGIARGFGSTTLAENLPASAVGDADAQSLWWESPLPESRFFAMRYDIYGTDIPGFALTVLFAMLLAIALTAPVFLLGVEQLRRSLATASINGATPAQLWRIALWQGLICSGLGALIGAGLGVAAAALWMWVGEGHGMYAVPVDVFLTFSALVIVSGIASAWLQALRFDTVAELLHPREGATHAKPRWWWLVGPVACVVGAVAHSFLLTGIGVILSGPLMLWIVSQLPLPLASRVSAAITPKSGLATGGVAALVFLGVFGNLAFFGDVPETEDQGFVRVFPAVDTTNDEALSKAAHDLIAEVHPEAVADLYSPFPRVGGEEGWSWSGFTLNTNIAIGSPEAAAVMGMPEDALEAIGDGKAVVFGYPATSVPVPVGGGEKVEIPAVSIDNPGQFGDVFVPLETAREAGVPLAYDGVIGHKERKLTLLEDQRFTFVNSDKTGLYTSAMGLGSTSVPSVVPFLGFVILGTIFMVVLLVALSSSHTLRDRKLLVSLGAPPRFIRMFGAYQGLLVSAAGAVLAGVATMGFAPRLLSITHGWILILAVPLVGFLTGWLASRPVNPALSRRTEEVVH